MEITRVLWIDALQKKENRFIERQDGHPIPLDILLPNKKHSLALRAVKNSRRNLVGSKSVSIWPYRAHQFPENRYLAEKVPKLVH